MPLELKLKCVISEMIDKSTFFKILIKADESNKTDSTKDYLAVVQRSSF